MSTLARLLGLLSSAALAAALRAPLSAARSPDPVDNGSDGILLSAREGTDLEQTIQGVVAGVSGTELEIVWARHQRHLAGSIQRAFPSNGTRFRILVVSAVGSTPTDTVDVYRDNMKKLLGNEAGDVFEFALFHYDNDDSEWRKHQWYQDSGIVMRHTKFLCTPQAWAHITPAMAERYDYVWLMDGDIRLDVFSWDLYREVLSALRPLVSQPAVIAKEPGARSTDIAELRMTGRDKGFFPIAREVERTEAMAPLISTRVWPAVYERMQHADLHSVWFLNDVWDLAGQMAMTECGQAGPLLVNAAPIRHMDHRDLTGEHGVPGRTVTCVKGCGHYDANCLPLGDDENELLKTGLREVCDVRRSPGLSCSKRLKKCLMELWDGVSTREWVETDGSIREMKYRCDRTTGCETWASGH